MVVRCKKNYYSILGVTPDSDNDEVKSSYRRLARQYHPDVNKDPDSAGKFKDILEAYETLSDDTKRKQYDMVNGFYKTPKRDFSKKYNRSYNYNEDLDEDDFEEDSSENEEKSSSDKQQFEKKYKKTQETSYSQSFFQDKVSSILDEISRKHSEKKQKRTPKNGDDVFTEITISLTEAVSGSERILNIMHKEHCPHCDGRKFINGTKCSKCGGTGIYEINRKITVKIPAGVHNNSKLRLVGEGNPGFFGGTNGNLYITLKVEKDDNMQIDGNNILYKLYISPFEAVLGAQIKVPSYDGKINLTIPPMTQNGQQFRLSKQGLKTNGKFGDMIITVEIQLPKDLSDEEIRLYKELKKSSKNNVRE